MKLRALDLFCGAGGATKGLQRAGFQVTGIDHRPQPRYCGDQFIRADALAPPVRLGDFDFIWASPPCQRWTALAQARGTDDDHPDLIEPTREILNDSGVPGVIENVPRAPLRRDVVLTGCMFGMNTYRRRVFEISFFFLAPPPGKPFGPKSRPGSVLVVGQSGGSSKRDGWSNGNKASWQEAMGINWMTNAEMAEAVPPAYAEFIGRAALRYLGQERAA